MGVTVIYKIEAPDNKIYIGQTRNVKERWAYYRRLKEIWRHNNNIAKSIRVFGHEKHIFTVLTELPADVDQLTLIKYENLYIEMHKCAGFNMLNQVNVHRNLHDYQLKLPWA
jgi:hypothetical protein